MQEFEKYFCKAERQLELFFPIILRWFSSSVWHRNKFSLQPPHWTLLTMKIWFTFTKKRKQEKWDYCYLITKQIEYSVQLFSARVRNCLSPKYYTKHESETIKNYNRRIIAARLIHSRECLLAIKSRTSKRKKKKGKINSIPKPNKNIERRREKWENKSADGNVKRTTKKRQRL